MNIRRVLVEVEYITWMPAEERLAARGQLDASAKISVKVRLWAPMPFNDRGEGDPSLMPIMEQGQMWAQNEVIKMRPNGHEVLAIVGCGALGVIEDTILNQPKQSEDETAALSKPVLFKP